MSKFLEFTRLEDFNLKHGEELYVILPTKKDVFIKKLTLIFDLWEIDSKGFTGKYRAYDDSIHNEFKFNDIYVDPIGTRYKVAIIDRDNPERDLTNSLVTRCRNIFHIMGLNLEKFRDISGTELLEREYNSFISEMNVNQCLTISTEDFYMWIMKKGIKS